MRIFYHQDYEKRFSKLPKALQEKTTEAVQKFLKNPFDPFLKNHALSGKMEGRKAFSVTGNVRIIFKEFNNYLLVLMLDIGTHNQVYK